MPQASDELRGKMMALFGDPIGAEKPMWYLRTKGYELTGGWEWRSPDGREPTENEIHCINFLIDEWDFGGIAKEKP